MEVDTGAEAALETGSSSSAFSSSILETAGESDESSQSIFLWKEDHFRPWFHRDSSALSAFIILSRSWSVLTSSHR